tara:strand:+ start:388 stop:810 length:423 start_codon:yes stop_codon:yes gene_type:complete
MAVKEIFAQAQPSKFEVAYGLLLGMAVTAMLGYQAFAYEHSDYTVDFDLRLVIFVAHVACLVFVTGDAVKFNGLNVVWAHFTIGSGIFATLGQIAVLAFATTAETQALALATLALQSYADALMLAFIIADLRLGKGYGSL